MTRISDQEPIQNFAMELITLDNLIEDIEGIAEDMKISIQDAIKVAEVYEIRRANDLKHADNTVKVEQLKSLGQTLKRIADSFQNMTVK